MTCSRVSCLAQTGFDAFGRGVQLISGSPYTQTEQLSRLTSPSGILALPYSTALPRGMHQISIYQKLNIEDTECIKYLVWSSCILADNGGRKLCFQL